MKIWTVYIIYSKTWDKYYTGVSTKINKRIIEHNKNLSPSTKGGLPWELVHYEEFDNPNEAYRREKFIKSKKSKQIIKKIINSPDVSLRENRDPDSRLKSGRRDSAG